MPKITGVRSVVSSLNKLHKDSEKGDNGEVHVGYTASYALPVHEAPPGTQFKRPGSQSKFLEQPAREMGNELRDIIRKARKRVSLIKALYIAGLALQRRSQEIVPVDTGNLRGSAFTRIVK